MTLPEELCNYIEALQYEVNARRDLCAFMVHHGMGDTEQFKKYHDEYVGYCAKYNVAKEMIGEMYGKGKWTLDFASRELKYED